MSECNCILKPHNDGPYLVRTPNGSVYRKNSRQNVGPQKRFHVTPQTPNFVIITSELKPDIGLGDSISSDDNLPINPPTYIPSKPEQSSQLDITRSVSMVKPEEKSNLLL
jgi:hypothetical protein